MANICTATVIVQYDKKDKKIGSVEIDNKEDFLKCVTGEAKSVTASAVQQKGSQESKVGDGGNVKRDEAGGRRKKSRGRKGGRKSKRRSSKKARKSKKSKRRRGKKSKRRRRRK